MNQIVQLYKEWMKFIVFRKVIYKKEKLRKLNKISIKMMKWEILLIIPKIIKIIIIIKIKWWINITILSWVDVIWLCLHCRLLKKRKILGILKVRNIKINIIGKGFLRIGSRMINRKVTIKVLNIFYIF